VVPDKLDKIKMVEMDYKIVSQGQQCITQVEVVVVAG
jgi:hypothetical protein